MKKIVSIIGVMVALVLSLTGCMKMDVDLVVSSPEKATYDMVMAFDKKVIGDIGVAEVLTKMGTTEEAFLASVPEGVTASPFEEGDFRGYTLSLQDKSLTEISDTSGTLGQKVSVEFRDGQYFFAAQGLAAEMASAVTESTMTVTFPGEVVSATEGAHIEGDTVTFDLLTAKGDLTAVANEKDNTALYLSLAFGGLALLGAVAGVVMMRKPETAETLHA
ncbi:LppM family (lipo)protein [Paeniglutamicibacter terrestris]|uniref:LppM domain-containing protein n=1 Tax=Paeniglutamicibacter terrestris TaxID=2723403 RepID=A0ABX1G8E9_9MICC|nr:hypothetical protein [Paeniglutamicibacter terrestris]ASN39913.1 hypothetical protein CGQ24_13430 [Arthrobacter sp. 7749]NKG22533.1 hypothetical protein [Paeniglutamicibacter terrestris]